MQRAIRYFQPGDELGSSRGTYDHRGLVLGFDHRGRIRILTSTPSGGAHIQGFEQFSAGRPVRVVAHHAGNPRVLEHRAQRIVGTSYDLLSMNCEHVISLVLTGRAASPQVQRWATVLVAGVAVGGLILASQAAGAGVAPGRRFGRVGRR